MPPSAGGPAGVVHLVGAGPGDPGLLTVRARDLLERSEVIVYDALANPEMLPSGAEGTRQLVFVGKRGGDARSWQQAEINALLVEHARAGRRVVRLKGGDPLVFGRGSEEAQALAAAGIPFEIVPGITAGIAAPAYAGIPVTHRGVATSVTFVTGHEDPDKPDTQTDWPALAALARAGGTIVLYMGVKTLPAIARSLTDGGLAPETPAAAVQWGTLPAQRTVVATLATLAERARAEGVSAPVITIIGEVVMLRDQIAWLERRPLFGRRIVVTRATAHASALSGRLRELGAAVIEMPATRIEPLDDGGLRAALARLSDFGWAIFTSANAVRLFWGALRDTGRDARALAAARIAAIGPATADALLEIGLVPDVVPPRFVAESLLETLRARDDVRGARVLYAAAADARAVLPSGLRALGADVEVVALYRSVPDAAGAAALRERLERGTVDLVSFTSASAVHAFLDAVGAELAAQAPAASIGPVTSEAARAAGIRVSIEATASTIEGLVEAVVRGA